MKTASQTTDAVLPKDPTAAERQRKYRERKKKKTTPEPDIFERDDRDVADSDAVTGKGEVAS